MLKRRCTDTLTEQDKGQIQCHQKGTGQAGSSLCAFYSDMGQVREHVHIPITKCPHSHSNQERKRKGQEY